jgi:hypothetical protein
MRTQAIRAFAVALLLAFVLPACAQLPAPTAISDAGFHACSHHTCVWVPDGSDMKFTRENFTYMVDIPAKDGEDGIFILRRAGKELLRTPLKELSASVSVVWADDNKHFAVTWSDGGAIGNFHVRAFRIDGDSVIELPAASKAFEAFKSRHWCETRGNNVQAYRWLPDSKQLILVLSVYPTGDCGKDLGHTEGYVVDASTGDIRQHWDLKQLNRYISAHPE